ncbi:Ulp1 protease family, carboxy-terminal domain protein [Sesbania bispinosa]|nr:Ulp1 protease family, carboxy-terminal domain protein [Sesbania bispinosa]
MKSRGKTPTRFSNRVRARRTNPNEAESRLLEGGRYSLKVKKYKPPVVEISSRHHDSILNKEFNDEWNPGNLEGWVSVIENKLEKVIKTLDTMSEHFMKNNGPQMSIIQSPTNLFPALGCGGDVIPSIDRRPKDETERILQKLCEEGGFSQNSGSVEKLFSSPLSARKSNTVLMTTATTSSYYLNSTNNFGHAEGLIGPDVPRGLKDLFKPINPINLSKEEAEVAANDCGAWVIMWMVEMGLNGYIIQVDEGTRLRIALDLAMNPYNTLQALIKTRAEDWMKTLD